ncbi:YqjF family protein [Halobacterium wangiae]|uniref:YqjF family protein n=1 Tax=Halobacterium wangiae TaxID=2902623 RepID=UPI001E637FB2|nr:DUF2071 domain-containing protein [Halobacterium wangiae]
MALTLSFGWRHVLFANWPVDGDRLAARLPDALAVDEYDGSGWLSVVPLLNVDTRLRGLPTMAGFPVPEVNVRTYVTYDGDPGVYFFSLDTASLLTVLGARVTHYLPYYYARVRFRRPGDRVHVTSRRRQPGDRPARFAATYGPTGDADTAPPGSLAEFLVERRRLYTRSPDGTLRHTNVSHDRWPLSDADVSITENSLFEANGFDHPDTEPVHYYSHGVDVVTSRSERSS